MNCRFVLVHAVVYLGEQLGTFLPDPDKTNFKGDMVWLLDRLPILSENFTFEISLGRETIGKKPLFT